MTWREAIGIVCLCFAIGFATLAEVGEQFIACSVSACT